MRSVLTLSFVTLASLCLVTPTVAEETSKDIEVKILQLSAILGRTHAIHVVCNGRSDQYWRNRMSELLELEAPEEGPWRQTLIERFNTAYEDQQSETQQCDAAAKDAFKGLANDGRRLSEELNTLISLQSE